MVDFSDRQLIGSAAPARFEVDLHDCEVTGEIPQVHGTWATAGMLPLQ